MGLLAWARWSLMPLAVLTSRDWSTMQYLIVMGLVSYRVYRDDYYSPVVPQPLTWYPRTTAGLGKHFPNRGNWYPSWCSSKAVPTASCWETCLSICSLNTCSLDLSGLAYQLSLRVIKLPILPVVFLRRSTNRLNTMKRLEVCPHALPATYKEETPQTWGWHILFTNSVPFSTYPFPRPQFISLAPLPDFLLIGQWLSQAPWPFCLVEVLELKKWNFRVV